MFIELVELLRCVREHDESWLVASIDEMTDRSIRRGTLGCPVCGEQYPIVGGIVNFLGDEAGPAVRPTCSGAQDLALRAGAFLNVAEGGGVLVLGGEWAGAAAELAETAHVRVIAVNAADDVAESPAIGQIRASARIPLAAASCAGIALDSSFGADAMSSAARAVRPGGRMVGPAGMTPPPGLAVLAEDETCWVAEKLPGITTLRRGNR